MLAREVQSGAGWRLSWRQGTTLSHPAPGGSDMDGLSATPPPREVTVQLLDPSYRRPIKTWKFVDRSVITVGRGDTADVLISDAYVSRVHAELVAREDQWILISRGRNGVMVGSQSITEVPIHGEIAFRLGSAGPALRFSTSAPQEAASATLSYSAESNPLLLLDETKLRDEVEQIVSDEYFQKLQAKVQALRKSRDTQVANQGR